MNYLNCVKVDSGKSFVRPFGGHPELAYSSPPRNEYISKISYVVYYYYVASSKVRNMLVVHFCMFHIATVVVTPSPIQKVLAESTFVFTMKTVCKSISHNTRRSIAASSNQLGCDARQLRFISKFGIIFAIQISD